MAEIRWTEEAVKWLEDIHAYITADNSTAAIKVIQGIYEKVQFLSDFPRMGYLYDNITDREVRVLLYGHYRIAYLLKPNDEIDILGVFHGALDITKYLF